MLKKLSKKGEYTQIFIICIVMLLFYFTPSVPLFEKNQQYVIGPLGNWLIQQALINPLLTKVIMMLMMVFISFFINRLAAASDIFPKQSFLSVTLLISIFLFTPELPYLTLNIALVTLMGVCLGSMMNIFGKQYPYLQVLNASMTIAVASMIIPQMIFFIIFIWIGFLTYSVNSWREWLISFIGLIIPYIYLSFAYFWNDNFGNLLILYKSFLHLNLFIHTLPSIYILVPLALMALLYLISAFNFTNDASDKIISIRKRMWLISQFSIISVIMLILFGSSTYLMLPVLFIPLSLMVAYAIHNQKKSRLYDIFITLFVGSVLISRIFA
ncbi:MAG TPA: DUF6427 family protein [Lentimicrobium sp.]|nr:DUF6427 family protein [Lentimicrobium sp.]